MNLLRCSRLLTVIIALVPCITAMAQENTPAVQRQWIEQMKLAERGPFSRIRWFCADGTILPPTPYACREHGGGHQHGEYTGQTQMLRDAGYLIANLLVELPPPLALEDQADRLKWVLLERFLQQADNGWILRRARYYRGAFQFEAETAAAVSILRTMLEQDQYQTTHFLLLREAARLLPWQVQTAALDRVRSLVITITEGDPDFAGLRNKLHSYPEPADIRQLEDYRKHVQSVTQGAQLDELIAALTEVFRVPELAGGLRQLAAATPAAESTRWQALANLWDQADSGEQQLAAAGRILVALREGLAALGRTQRQQAMLLGLAAEQAAYKAGVDLAATRHGHDRHWYLQRLKDNLDVLYGIGFLTRREWQAQHDSLAALPAQPALADYRNSLDYLARLPAWADARFDYFFGGHLYNFAVIEPRVSGFVPDRLRGSPLVLHSRLMQELSIDAGRLAGVHHEIFGNNVTLGLRALNPGVARGPLRVQVSDQTLASGTGKPVVLVPETTADLPAVAGILTEREGNALSHVQLLARNLGIPNVVVSPELLAQIAQRDGQQVVLLASPAGIVRLVEDGPHWDHAFPATADKPLRILPDLDKLDLTVTAPQSLADLRATDSGRIAGPKAAGLGELKARFPDAVSAGLVLPFGLFRRHLEQTMTADGTTLFDWMRQNYTRLDGIQDKARQLQETNGFLTQLRERIRTTDLEPGLRDTLTQHMAAVFGPSGSYGVFVRSDTNVEDLPGFTGAGLNLTVPNVTGTDAIIEAIKAVWASPFTERAFGWRQALMDQPEHVYVSVLLHQSVPADKSGVMVTADIGTNSRDIYTVSVNEGVGGGVEGQASETIAINVVDSSVTLLSTAAEPNQRVLPAEGGVRTVAASGAEAILTENEINQLLEFGRSLPVRFPELVDAEGQIVPADVEFAFVQGRLNLIQIRPFLQSYRARRSRVLAELDARLADRQAQPVNLLEVPLQE